MSQTPLDSCIVLWNQHHYKARGDRRVETRNKNAVLTWVEAIPLRVTQGWLWGRQVADKEKVQHVK